MRILVQVTTMASYETWSVPHTKRNNYNEDLDTYTSNVNSGNYVKSPSSQQYTAGWNL